jgi:aminopeptidase
MAWEKLHSGQIEEALIAAAKNAVKVCLGSRQGERATIICDEASKKGAAAIALAFEQEGVEVQAFLIEDLGRRPVLRFPTAVTQQLSTSDVSVFWAVPQPGELRARTQILDIAVEKKLRHAHIMGINIDHFISGLNVDYSKIEALQGRLIDMLRTKSMVRVTSPAGTVFSVPLEPGQEFVGVNGIIKPGSWENLPSGQIMSVPASASGTFVADGSVGEWFGTKYGDISSNPLCAEIEDGKLKDARCLNQRLAREFLLYVRSNPNGDRIGEFSLGTNIGLHDYTGMPSIDENVPGCHVAFGNPPAPLNRSVGWEAKTKVSLIGKRMSIYLDDVQIMWDGKFDPSLMK